MKPSCKICKYYVGKELFGDCFRYPMPTGVTEDHWCGEFKSKSTTEKEPKPRVSKDDMDSVISTYRGMFMSKFGASPAINKVDYAAAKKMILEDGAEKTADYIREFFNDTPKWNLDNKVLDLRVIPGLRNKLTVASAPGLVVDIRQFLDACSDGERHSRLWPEYADYVKKTGKKISMKDWVKEVNG